MYAHHEKTPLNFFPLWQKRGQVHTADKNRIAKKVPGCHYPGKDKPDSICPVEGKRYRTSVLERS